MLDQFFGDRRAHERARSSASGPHLDGFSQWLHEVGYAPRSILEFLRTAVHLGLWTARRHTPIGDLDEALIERFRLHLRRCRCPGRQPRRPRDRWIASRATRFLQYLRQQGAVRETPPRQPVEVHPLLAGFDAWMRQYRNATPATLRTYGRVVTGALEALGDDPAAFNARGLRDFVLDRSKGQGRSKAKQVTTAMRAFLRYLIASNVCHPDLVGAIPTIAGWRLASLPRYLPSADVDHVIAGCDASTTSGARNRAILLLMARLGLRAGDISALRREDLDWRHATLEVAGKSRRATRLPLPQEVGDAILAYLSRGLPKDCTDRVFLRLAPPWGPIAPGSASSIASRAIRAAGVGGSARGAHALRHSAATDLLRQGASLDLIQLVLRHQDPETTRLYAKVDVESLRRIAQSWPEVTPC